MPAQRDIRIRISGRPNETSGYPVEATLDDDSYFGGGELRIPAEELLTLELDLQHYGLRLGQSLFCTPIQRAFAKAYATVASQAASQMRVLLSIDSEAADLHAYPWERVLIDWQGAPIPLAASSQVPFSRFISLEEGRQDPIDERPVRVLLAVSNPVRLPAGLEHIDVEAQLRVLLDAISGIPDLRITVLPGHTSLSDEFKQHLDAQGHALLTGATTLQRLADAAGTHHVVHLLCHGTYQNQTASLFLENEDGDVSKTADDDIAMAIRSLSQKPKLIYLSACDSANQAVTAAPLAQPRTIRPLVGLAPKLVEAGVPAVIAMQTQVDIDSARTLASTFYAKVLEYGEVDRALSEARFAISNTPDWWIPVLFLRLRNGRLFNSDPVRQAIDAMLASLRSYPDRHYLPLEAVSLKGKELIEDWDRTSSLQRSGADLWQLVQGFRPGLTVLTGNAGTGKSTLLYRLARAAAEHAALPRPVGQALEVPLIVDLAAYANAPVTGFSRARNLIFETFRKLAPALTEAGFDRILSGQAGVLLRFLFDNADQMSDRARPAAIREIEQMATGSPHQFLLAIDCRLFEPSDAIQELLVIRPLSPRKVVRFLSPIDSSDAEKLRAALLEAIQSAGLFELAAMPWLLLHMLDQVQRILPRSRVMVLEDWVSTALQGDVDAARGFRAKESLYALGWKMHSERLQTISVEDAFEVLREVRSRREYDLEKLLTLLVNSGMLTRLGEETLRFTYPALQTYCAACSLLNDPRRATLIDEVVATLGQLNRVVWWGRVLSLLSGMMPDPTEVLQPLVYGASLTQGEQVFIAAECLAEHRRSGLKPADPLALESFCCQTVAALLWRTRRANEFRYAYRERAAEALGLYGRKETIPTLLSLAIERVRDEDSAGPQFEYSQVRAAAIRSLLHMRALITSEMLAQHPSAGALITAWTTAEARLETLTLLLKSGDEGIQGAAAFALGEMQTPASAQVLFDAFRDPATLPSTLWSITDALRSLEPEDVMTRLVLPCIEQAGNPASAAPPVTPMYERLIYLIGELRTPDPRARKFVCNYLVFPCEARFKGRALSAMGKLHAVEEAAAHRWEDVIHGDFSGIAAKGDPNVLFLRRKAIEAIGELGDITTLNRARRQQDWVPELDEAFFRAAEACLTFPQNA